MKNETTQTPEWKKGLMKYRKKPIVIEAVRLTWEMWQEVCEFLGNIISVENPARESTSYSDTCGEEGPPWIELTIPTLEGSHTALHGDWIVKGVKGEFYPVKPDVFKATYEEANDN